MGGFFRLAILKFLMNSVGHVGTSFVDVSFLNFPFSRPSKETSLPLTRSLTRIRRHLLTFEKTLGRLGKGTKLGQRKWWTLSTHSLPSERNRLYVRNLITFCRLQKRGLDIWHFLHFPFSFATMKLRALPCGKSCTNQLAAIRKIFCLHCWWLSFVNSNYLEVNKSKMKLMKYSDELGDLMSLAGEWTKLHQSLCVHSRGWILLGKSGNFPKNVFWMEAAPQIEIVSYMDTEIWSALVSMARDENRTINLSKFGKPRGFA